MDTFALWEEGEITDREALRAIWVDLREIEDQVAALEAERQRLREQIGQIVARTGPVTIQGLGSAQLTSPSLVVSYDRERLDQLVAALAARLPEVAAEISACRREQQRSGTLRITAERPRQS